MKTENECNGEILKTTETIEEIFPELVKYINEMPINSNAKPDEEINKTSLETYNDSLDAFWKRYAMNHNTPHLSPTKTTNL